VVLDGAWAEEQPAADLGVGESVAGQAGDLALAGGELGGRGRSALAGGFAGGEEFPAGAFGEGFGSDLGEQIVGDVELFVWRGWPFVTVASRPARLTIAHVTVIGGGIVSYLVLRELLGLNPARITALGGCFVAAGLLFGMLLEGWLGDLSPAVERVALVLATLALAALLAVALQAIATRAMHLTRSAADEWVGHAALNALAISIILHVAVGRRWPFPHPADQTARTSGGGSGSVDV
jgi:hypothetical protein